MADEATTGRLKLKLVRSTIGCNRRQRETVRSLGLRRMQQVVEHTDTAVVRGMIERVKHLVLIVDESSTAQ